MSLLNHNRDNWQNLCLWGKSINIIGRVLTGCKFSTCLKMQDGFSRKCSSVTFKWRNRFLGNFPFFIFVSIMPRKKTWKTHSKTLFFVSLFFRKLEYMSIAIYRTEFQWTCVLNQGNETLLDSIFKIFNIFHFLFHTHTLKLPCGATGVIRNVPSINASFQDLQPCLNKWHLHYEQCNITHQTDSVRIADKLMIYWIHLTFYPCKTCMFVDVKLV